MQDRFIKVRKIIKILAEEGWYMTEVKGSHRHFKHPAKSGRVTVCGKINDSLCPGTLANVFRQAQISPTLGHVVSRPRCVPTHPPRTVVSRSSHRV